MAWRRDEIWFDADVAWFRERSGGQSPALALQAPAFFGLAADALQAVDTPNGLAASRPMRCQSTSRMGSQPRVSAGRSSDADALLAGRAQPRSRSLRP